MHLINIIVRPRELDIDVMGNKPRTMFWGASGSMKVEKLVTKQEWFWDYWWQLHDIGSKLGEEPSREKK
jgi:hypothetical protein